MASDVGGGGDALERLRRPGRQDEQRRRLPQALVGGHEIHHGFDEIPTTHFARIDEDRALQ